MRVHVVRHVRFEGPGAIADWAVARGHDLAETLALTEEFPPLADVDFLVVMGGPMDADDPVASPWLPAEKTFVRAAVDADKPVLGVCLGAQILAEVLGGTVMRASEREIGWYPVHFTPPGAEEPVFAGFPDGLVVGHWHGDTFTTPPGATPVLTSALTPNQAFSAEKAVGVQFHLEWRAEDIEALIEACGDELTGLDWVSTEDEMRAWGDRYMPACHEALFGLLDRMAGGA